MIVSVVFKDGGAVKVTKSVVFQFGSENLQANKKCVGQLATIGEKTSLKIRLSTTARALTVKRRKGGTGITSNVTSAFYVERLFFESLAVKF